MEKQKYYQIGFKRLDGGSEWKIHEDGKKYISLKFFGEDDNHENYETVVKIIEALNFREEYMHKQSLLGKEASDIEKIIFGDKKIK